MHSSVCLFSKYLQHLLEGENSKELDISSASSSNNIFRNKKTISTGWTGTCPLLTLFGSIQSKFEEELSTLKSINSSVHQKTMKEYETTTNLIDNLFYVYSLNEERPSGSKEKLTPVFESEFSDKTNASQIGGEIYFDFSFKLKPIVEILNVNIIKDIISLINSNTYKSNIDGAYLNFVNFDTAVANANNIMNNNILDLKDYFLTLQFLLMLFTWGYFIFFLVLAFLYIMYMARKNEILYYIIIILVNILFVMMLFEIFLSSFFGQIRLICHEVPRAMNFIFTGTYMVSGNGESYSAQFGRGNANMTEMFTNCLNGDKDLVSLYVSSDFLNVLSTIENNVNNLQNIINEIISKSNIITNEYDSIENSIFLKAIIQLKLMKDNLYFASKGFGEDDIYKILTKIRNNLDSENCGMTNEHYVVRESDCPLGSIKANLIYDSPGSSHCYIIQKLTNGAQAEYSATGCDNAYINKAIDFIKEIDSILEIRLLVLENLQKHYSLAYENLKNEINNLSQTLKTYNSIINTNLDLAKNISNCGSSRFDLIDFSDFIGDTTEYDARIVVIFSAFLGVFGFVLLYSFLVVINGLNGREEYDDDYGNDFKSFSKKGAKKYRNKRKRYSNKYYESNDDEEEEEEDDNVDDYKQNKKNRKSFKSQSKAGKKVEMSILAKNNDDSDSS